MIWEVFKTIILYPAKNWHKVSYKTGDLTFDQGRITHYHIDLALWICSVLLNNNWKIKKTKTLEKSSKFHQN